MDIYLRLCSSMIFHDVFLFSFRRSFHSISSGGSGAIGKSRSMDFFSLFPSYSIGSREWIDDWFLFSNTSVL